MLRGKIAMKMFFNVKKIRRTQELQVFRSSLLLPNQKQEVAERLKKVMASIGAEYSKSLKIN